MAKISTQVYKAWSRATGKEHKITIREIHNTQTWYRLEIDKLVVGIHTDWSGASQQALEILDFNDWTQSKDLINA